MSRNLTSTELNPLQPTRLILDSDDSLQFLRRAEAHHGGLGSDRLRGSIGDDVLVGKGGNDTLSGKDGDDILRGNAGRDVLKGGKGFDTLKGGGDQDRLVGGKEGDRLVGQADNDVLVGQAGDDALIGGGGNDRGKGGKGNDRLKGRAGEDILAGGGGNDTLKGGNGKNVLEGDAGDDTLVGGTERDVLQGGLGRDVLTGGGGDDVFVVSRGQGEDLILDFESEIDTIGLSGDLDFEDLEFQSSGDNTVILLQDTREVLATLVGVTSGLIQPIVVSDRISLQEGESISYLTTNATTLLDNDIAAVTEQDAITFVKGNGFQTVVGELGSTRPKSSLSLNPTVIGPLHGALTLKSDGTFTYRHDGSENLSDRFTYEVLSSDGMTAAAEVLINITPVNDAPEVVTNKGASIVAGETISISRGVLLATDSDHAASDIRYTLTHRPDHGQLEHADAPGVAITSFTQAEVNAKTIVYVHDGSVTTSDQFRFRLSDGVTTGEGSTFSIAIDATANLPILDLDADNSSRVGGGNTRVAFTENDAPVAIATEVTITDPNSTELTSVTLTLTTRPDGMDERLVTGGTLPSNITASTYNPVTGSLVLTGTASLADYAAAIAQVQYENGSDDPTAGDRTITVVVSDGTVSGNVVTSTVTVTPVNDAPSLITNTGITVLENSFVAIASAALSGADLDDTAAELTYSVIISPTHGYLALANNPTVAITAFTQANLEAEQVRYVQNGDEETTDSFAIALADGGEDGSLPVVATVAVTITPQNDSPQLNTNTGATVDEGGTVTLTPSEISGSDADTVDTALTYTVTGEPSHGQLERVSNPGVKITAFTQDDLVNNRVVYLHNGDESASDSFQFSLGDGESTPVTGTFNLSINPVNDAPMLDNAGDLAFTAVLQDVTDPTGDIVANLLASDGGNPITDADAGAVKGIAIIGLANSQGTWELSTNNGNSWVAFDPATSETNATLLNATARIRFIPATGFTGEILDGLTFRAWDTTDGNASGTTGIDVSMNGGSTAYSSATETARIRISPLNDAPTLAGLDNNPAYVEAGAAVLLDNNVTIADVELDALNAGLGNYSGARLTVERSTGASLDDGFSFGFMAGIAVNGSNLEVGGVAIATILATGGTLTITFTDANGEIPTTARVNTVLQAIQYENSSNNPPATVELTVTINDGNTGDQGIGGALEASAALTVNLTASNDAPVLDPALDLMLDAVAEDATNPTGTSVADVLTSAGSNPVTDDDAGAVVGIAVIGLDTTSGVWEFSLDNGISWTGFGPVSDTSATLLDSTALIRLIPAANFNGEILNGLTFRAWDTTDRNVSGTTGVDVSVNGDTTAYSTATDTAQMTVTPINDAPSFIGLDNAPTFIEGGTPVELDSDATVADADLDALSGGAGNYSGAVLMVERVGGGLSEDAYRFEAMPNVIVNGANLEVAGVAIATITTTGDALSLKFTDANGEIPTTALVNEILQAVQYSNDTDEPAVSVDLVFTLDDGNTGEQGSGGSLQDTETLTVTLTPTNDAPVLGNPATGVLSYTEGDGAVSISTSGLEISDPDDTQIESATVQITDNYQLGEDVLAIATLPVGVTASFDATSGTLTLSGRASLTDYTSALQQVTYENTSSNAVNLTRTVTFTVNDGNADSAGVSRDILVNPVNDAPTLDASGNLQLTAVAEDDPDPAGNTVAEILLSGGGNPIADPDTGAVEGIAITAVDTSHGSWEFSLDGGASWTLVSGVSATSALVLGAIDRLRFIPDPDFTGDSFDSVTFHAWDTTDGSLAGSLVNPTPGGGTTAFSVNTETASVTVNSVNDAPTLADFDDSPNFTEGGTPIPLDTDATISDVELDALNGGAGNYSGAVLTVERVGGGLAEDAYSFGTMGSITVNGSNLEVGGVAIATFSTAANVFTISFTDVNGAIPTTALVNTILQAIQYANSSDNPPATVQLQVAIADGNTGSQGVGGSLEASGTLTISITPDNDSPVLAGAAAGSLTYDENDPATAISPTELGITDPDSTQINSATVVISSGYVNGEDELVAIAPLPGGIMSSFDATTGTLTLSGNASLAQYTTVLQSIGYRNISNSPILTTRTVSFTVNDGTDSSNTVSRDLTIINQNDAPTLDASGDLALASVAEDEANSPGDTIAALLLSDGGDRLTDPDVGAVEGIAVTGLDTLNGTWEFSLDNGISWTIFGAVSDTSATLLDASARIRFVPNADFNGEVLNGIRFRAWDTTDGNLSGATGINVSVNGDTTAYSVTDETAAITVTAINDTPSYTNLGGAIAFTEDGPAVILDGDATISDVELDALNSGTGNYSGATFTVSRSGGANLDDSFSIRAGAGVTVNGSNLEVGGVAIATFTAIGGTLTLTFTDANGEVPTTALVNAILQNIQYSNSSNMPPASVNLDVTFNDGNLGDQGNGGALTALETITVNITPTNDAPVLSATAAASTTYSENDMATVLSPTGLGIADPDDTQIESATVQITGNYQSAEDLLALTGTLPDGITTIGFDAVSGSLILTGSASLANYTAALRQIGYVNSSENPNTGDRTLSFTVNDGDDNSNTVTQTLSITAVNDAPVLDASSDLALADVNQDDTDPVGTSVAALLTSGGLADAITDPDSGAVEGIAVVAIDNSHGTWEYSVNGGSSWLAFGNLSTTNAVLLTNTAQIRFVPDGSFLGFIPNGLTFHAWDTTDGNPSGTTGVSMGTTGDASPFSLATDTVSLDVTLETPPVLTDDNYTVEVNTTLTRVTSDADDLLDNDDSGTPATDIASFGGGDLGGDATSNAAGSSVSLADGTLTVNADGSFTLVNPTTPGSFSFSYRLDNGIGSDVGTVTIEVQQAPTAVNDTVAPGSTPINDGVAAATDDPYHTGIDTLLTVVEGATDVLANDDLGFQTATLKGFGDSAGTVTAYAPGTTGTTAQGGTLVVNADGSFDYTPVTDFIGLDSFFYQIENTVNGRPATSIAEVILAVGDRPLAVDDTYTSIGNIGIEVDLAGGILANDSGSALNLVGFGESLATADDTLTGNTLVTASGSTLLLNADGSFDYTPGVGFTGTETFFYTIQNGFGTEVGQIDIAINNIIWFIDNSATSSTNVGTFSNPFTSLDDFNAVNDGLSTNPGNDAILYLAAGSGSYTGGLTLRDGQVLIGQGASSDIATLTGITVPTYSKTLLVPDGAAPTLTNASGSGITLGTNNSIYGINLGNTDSAGIAGTNFGLLTLRDVDITGTGRILDLNNGSLDVEFGTLITTSSSGGEAIAIRNSTGGNFSVTNTTTISGSEAGINLFNNSSATFDFATLNITTTNGSALTAIGGGSVTSTGGAISADNGAALNLQAILADLRFSTLSSTDSTLQGINLTDLIDGSSVRVSGDINITHAAAEGIRLGSAADAAVSFDLGGSTMGALTVNNAANVGIQIDQAGAGSDIRFGTILIQNRNDTGVLFDNVEGSIYVESLEDINDTYAGGYGLRIEDSAAAVYIENLQISDAVTTISESLSLGMPITDGDGDGIFLTNNSGDFTINNGTIEFTEGEAIDVRSVSGTLDLRVTIGNVLGDGIQLVDIAGADHIFRELVVYNIESDRAGIEWWGSGTSEATLTVDSAEFQGASAATNNTGITLKATDVYSARLNVIEASLINTNDFDGLNGYGIDVVAAGSSQVVTIIENANLIDAEGANGRNGIRHQLQDTASIHAVIDGANLSNVMLGMGQAGAIEFVDTTASDGTLIAKVRNSSIINSDQLGIHAEFAGSTDADLTFDNNILEALGQQGLRTRFRGTSTGVLRLRENFIGTPIDPVGINTATQTAAQLMVDTTNGTIVNAVIDGNLVAGSGSTGEAMVISVGGTDTLNLSTTGNTFQDVSGLDSFIATTTTNTATLRMLLQDNRVRDLLGSPTTFEIDNTANGILELDASGNTGLVNPSGTIVVPLSSPLPSIEEAPADP